MKLGVNTCTWSRAGLSLPEALAEVRKSGLRYVDIFGRGHGDPRFLKRTPDLLAATSEIIKENRLVVASYCALVPHNPGNEAWFRENLDYMRSAMEIAQIWNCRKVILDTGERERGTPAAAAWASLVNLAGHCARLAEEMEIFLTVEMEPYAFNLVNTLDRMLQLVREVNSPNLLLNVDTGHLNVIRADPSELEVLQGLVVHVHVSENSGIVDSHDEIGCGNTPNGAYLEALSKAGYEDAARSRGLEAVASIEIHNILIPPIATPAPAVQVQRSCARMLECFTNLQME